VLGNSQGILETKLRAKCENRRLEVLKSAFLEELLENLNCMPINGLQIIREPTCLEYRFSIKCQEVILTRSLMYLKDIVSKFPPLLSDKELMR